MPTELTEFWAIPETSLYSDTGPSPRKSHYDLLEEAQYVRRHSIRALMF